MSEDDLNTLGMIADDLDAATYTAKLPLPPAVHVDAMSGIIAETRDKLKAFCVERGFDPWSEA